MPLPQKIIPDWVFYSDPSGQMRAGAGDRAQRASKPQVIQAPTLAENAWIPIIYGGPERIAGMPYTCCLASNGLDLLVSFIVCEGEVEAISNVEVNNAALPAGVTISAYAGTQSQGIDPDLAAAIPGYDERHLGTAYLVGRFPPASVNGVPNVTVEVMGRKILDRSTKGVTFSPAPLFTYATLAESAQGNMDGATKIEVVFIAALAQWGASANPQVLVAKWITPARITLGLQINPSGTLALYYSTTGTSPFEPALGFVCPLLIPHAPGQFGGVRVVADLAVNGNSTAQFYSSTDGVVWTPLGGLVTIANNYLPATPLNVGPWGGAAQIVADGVLGGFTAWKLTDSDAANYQAWGYAVPIPATATTWAYGFRVKKTTGPGTVFVLNLNCNTGGTQTPGPIRINTTTGEVSFYTGVGSVKDRGDHWEVRSQVKNTTPNVFCNFNMYPAMALPGDLVNLTPTATGSATVSDLWLSRTAADLGGVKWQVSSRGEATEGPYPIVGTVYRVSVKWGGVEHVRFNPEDAADGAVTWLAPTGEAWTVFGGPTVQSRPAFRSNNPALIIDDFMRVFGRRTVNAASVRVARDFCDAIMSDSSARSRLTLTLAEGRDVNEWIEVLRQYIPAWIVFKDNEWHIIVDAPSAPVLAYDADTDNRTDGDAPMLLVKRGVRDVPNVIEVAYVDTSAKPWTEKKAVAAVPGIGTGERRKTGLAMPGIRSYGQAYRVAVERLNHFTLESIEGEFAVFDNGIAILPGDIVTITDAAHGFAVKPVRVLRADEKDNGRWQVRFREYNASAYSTDAPAAPALPSSGTLPNPLNVSAITGLSAVEVLRFEKNLDTNDGLARGLIWQSRIEASWTASPDPFLDFYEIALTGSTLTQPAVSTSKLAKFSSATLVQNTTYQVQVRVVNTLGFVGAWATVSILVAGKVNPPSNVTIVDFAAEIGGEVILRWRAVPDVDVVRYEWRALATSAASAAWDSMALVDRPDTTYARFKGLAPGATLFAVKAIDSVGRYSVTPFFVGVTITSDSSNFLQTFDFVPTSGDAMTRHEWPLVEGDSSRPLPRWITVGNLMFAPAGMPNPVGSANAPVVSGYGRQGAHWAHACQGWDWGLVLEATVRLNLSWIRTLNDVTIVYLIDSLDGTTWNYTNSWALGVGANLGTVSAKVTARFVSVQFWSVNAYGMMMQEGPVQAQVSSTTRSESGNGTSVASGATRINLAQKYTKAVSVVITPRGTTFATGSYDNVVVGIAVAPNYFDVYLFNAAGVQIAQAFSWNFEGV